MQITDLGLSVRATNCLHRAGIMTVEELRKKRTWELQSIRSFGAKCMQEVREALERLQGDTVLQRWIPVEEFLPKHNTRVLVYSAGHFAISEIYAEDPFDGCPMWDFTGTGADPTHWMPLPEPPKEG